MGAGWPWRALGLASVAALPVLAGAAAKLPAGTVVRLELQHTVTSAYTPADTPVYFRVKEDVQVDGRVLVRAGALVTGRMTNAQDRRMMGQSGVLAYGVRFVPAVDGQQVRVIAGTTRAGRDRDDALATDIIFWGVFGLMTHGANAWIERGAILEAQVLSDRQIDVDKAAPAETATPAPAFHAQRTGHQLDFTRAKTVELNLEKTQKLGMIRFDLQPDAALAGIPVDPAKWQLVAVDDTPLPVPLAAVAADRKGVAFEAWSVLQYCRDGDNHLHFSLDLGDGRSMDALDLIPLRLVRKK